MPNLYKQCFVVSETDHTRIINSNQMVEEKLAKLEQEYQAKQRGFAEPDADGFQAGIPATEVEVDYSEEEPVDDSAQLEDARNQAEEILAEARNQADQILEEARNQADAIRQQAKEEGNAAGYQEGCDQAKLELQQEKNALEEERQQMQEQYETRLSQMEPELVDTIIQVFDRVFHIQYSDKREILLYLVTKTMTGADGTSQFHIRVGQDNYLFLETHKDEITAAAGEHAAVSVVSDPLLDETQCMIETENGIYDCSMDTELKNLLKDIKSLSL